MIIAAALNSCNRDTYEDYFGATPYDVISIVDVRPVYKGEDVTLTKDVLYGGTKLAAVVISDHTEKNLPEGLLIVQDSRRLLNTIRGISIELGAAAANYHPGDSVMIQIDGGTLTRKNGILTITGVTASQVTVVGKGIVDINAITSKQLNANPDIYESTLCLLNKSSFNPSPKPGDVISGTKVINDGFENVSLYTDTKVSFAHNAPYGLAAYVGIPLRTNEGGIQLRIRNVNDIVDMGSSAQDLLITGLQTDPKGGDGGCEYVQMLATKDIDFAVTPYCIVFSINSGNSSSATPLTAGWATGGQRTLKYNITSMSVKKGKFFYFGFQTKKINGPNSIDTFPGATFYQKSYITSGNNAVTGAVNLPNIGDGGLVKVSEHGTSGPFANIGNTCGVALFKGTSITETSVPEDVLFIATGGTTTVYDATKSPILGYRICNNDWYSMYSVIIDQGTYKPTIVPYLHYRSAVNMTSMPYPVFGSIVSDAGLYNMMGGTYNITLGRWTVARKQTVVPLDINTATIDTLERHPSVTKLIE